MPSAPACSRPPEWTASNSTRCPQTSWPRWYASCAPSTRTSRSSPRGGINPGNAAAYAATGVDGLATTAPFAAKPLDMSVRMHAL